MKKITAPHFSEDSLSFLKLAGKQKSLTWIDKNKTKHVQLIQQPLMALAAKVKKELVGQAPGYHFPQQGIGRIKRPANRVRPGEPIYKDWVSYIVTTPPKSRFEKNPHLFFGLLPNEAGVKGVVVAGGLYMTSSLQLKRIRSAIAADAEPFKELFRDKEFKKSFKTSFNDEMKAKNCPRGFAEKHPDMEWLKLKTFFVSKNLTMKEFSSANLSKKVAKDFEQLLRLNRLLQKAIDGHWNNS